MSLEGTLDTLSIPEVLNILESGHKSGALDVYGEHGEGRLYFGEGQICAGAPSSQSTPSEPGSRSACEAILTDICFDMVRQSAGTFEFKPGIESPWSKELSFPVADILKPAQDAVSEWFEIAKVIPDFDVPIAPTPELPIDEVTLGRDEWRILVAIDGEATVSQIAHGLERSRIEVARVMHPLVTSGVLTVLSRSEHFADPSTPFVEEAVSEISLEAERPQGRELEEPEEVDSADRGSLLRMFSSLRED